MYYKKHIVPVLGLLGTLAMIGCIKQDTTNPPPAITNNTVNQGPLLSEGQEKKVILRTFEDGGATTVSNVDILLSNGEDSINVTTDATGNGEVYITIGSWQYWANKIGFNESHGDFTVSEPDTDGVEQTVIMTREE